MNLETKTINLKEIIAKYPKGENFWRVGLCRWTFDKHRIKEKGKFVYNNTQEFRDELKDYLKLKNKKNSPHGGCH